MRVSRLLRGGRRRLTLGDRWPVAMLALAIPALEITKTDWRANADYAVTFPRPLRQRDVASAASCSTIRCRCRSFRSPDQGAARHRGPALLRAFRHRRRCSCAIVATQVVPGVPGCLSLLTQQLAKNLFLSNERTFDRKIKEAFLAICLRRNTSKQEIRSSIRPRLRKRRHARVKGGEPVLFRQVGARHRLPRRRCSPASSLRRPATPRTSTCRYSSARAPTTCALQHGRCRVPFHRGSGACASAPSGDAGRLTRTYSARLFLDYAFQAIRDMAPVNIRCWWCALARRRYPEEG